VQCPKCSADMETLTVDEIEVDRCGGCEGLWFDLREHEHLREKVGAERIDVGNPAKGRAYDTLRDIDCPRCKARMVKLAFPDQPHIHYEQCSTCGGAFLDAGEFNDLMNVTISERIRQFLGPRRT